MSRKAVTWQLMMLAFVLTGYTIISGIEYGLMSNDYLAISGLTVAPSVGLAGTSIYLSAKDERAPLRGRTLYRTFSLMTMCLLLFTFLSIVRAL